jgi:hypothetical protein
MQYSPKLKKVMEQIKEILKENDIAGFVVLHTPGHSEYLNHVQTSYSCATVLPEGVRLRLKQSEVGKEKAEQLANGTYNMITHLTTAIAANAEMYLSCHEQLKKKWEGKETGGGHTSHNQQNN